MSPRLRPTPGQGRVPTEAIVVPSFQAAIVWKHTEAAVRGGGLFERLVGEARLAGDLLGQGAEDFPFLPPSAA